MACRRLKENKTPAGRRKIEEIDGKLNVSGQVGGDVDQRAG